MRFKLSNSNKIKDRFTLTSPTEAPEKITSSVNVKPDRAWRSGDIIEKTTMRRKSNGWQLVSQTPSTGNLDEHLEGLAERMYPLAGSGELQGWAAELSLTVYIYEASSPALNITPTMVRFCSEFGAGIDIDVYCLQDVEE